MSEPTVSEGEDSEPARDTAEVRLFAAERLVFFSDALVAIAITLLALDLPLPSGRTWGDLATSLGDNLDAYIAFALTFLVVANAWVGHHILYRWVVDVDSRLMGLNLIWLLVIVLMPFFTKLVVQSEVVLEFRFIVYAGAQVLLGALMWWMTVHAERAGLVLPSAPDDLVRGTIIRCLITMIPFGLSIPAVFVIGRGAFFFWYFGSSVTSIFFSVRRNRARRRARESAARPTR